MNLQSLIVFIALLELVPFSVSAQPPKLRAISSDVQFENANLLASIELDLNDKDHVVLWPVSHGLRKGALYGLVPVPVYVLQFLAKLPDKLIKNDDGIIRSMKEAGPVQLRFSFLRDMPASKVIETFKEGLEANKISVRHMSAELEQFLNEIKAIGDFKKTSEFSVTTAWKDHKTTILLERPDGEIKTIAGTEEMANQLFSIWFGKPSDPKIKQLKQDLIR